ncbi:hypothetical protein MHYP_G00306670 [Metynnis hypsauchen]
MHKDRLPGSNVNLQETPKPPVSSYILPGIFVPLSVCCKRKQLQGKGCQVSGLCAECNALSMMKRSYSIIKKASDNGKAIHTKVFESVL